MQKWALVPAQMWASVPAQMWALVLGPTSLGAGLQDVGDATTRLEEISPTDWSSCGPPTSAPGLEGLTPSNICAGT